MTHHYVIINGRACQIESSSEDAKVISRSFQFVLYKELPTANTMNRTVDCLNEAMSNALKSMRILLADPTLMPRRRSNVRLQVESEVKVAAWTLCSHYVDAW